MTLDKNKTLSELLRKHQENSLTQEESAALAGMISESKNREAVINIINDQLKNFNSGIDQVETADTDTFSGINDRIRKRISILSENSAVSGTMKVRNLIIRVASIAAVLLILFYIATLTVSTGKNNNGSAIGNSVSQNIISTPYGSISKLMLADGSEIIINAGSSIKYDAGFNISNRIINLEGEAYFKVNRQTEVPFIVNSGDISIKTVGTTFNVKAYAEESAVEMTLIEGSVLISKKNEGKSDILSDLGPGQKAIFIKDPDVPVINEILEREPGAYHPSNSAERNLLVSEAVDVSQITAWTNNELVIKSEKLETLVIKLQRKYDVEFIFDDEKVKQYRFTGLLQNEPIEQVLNAICLSAPVSYIIDGSIVKLRSVL